MIENKDWLCVWAGDFHTLSSTAIAIPGYPIATEDNRPYQASHKQEWLYRCWWHFYNTVKEAAQHYRLMFLYGGDGIDGPLQHGTRQTMGDRSDAISMTVDLLSPFIQLSSAKFAVTGTGAHVGESADEDRSVAARLEMEIRDVWEMEIDGRKLLWSHHGIGLGSREWTIDNAMVALAKDKDIECAKHPERFRPDIIVAHHVHRAPRPVTIRGITVMTIPCWQLPTRWATQKFPYKQVDIGWSMWHPKSNRVYQHIYKQDYDNDRVII